MVDEPKTTKRKRRAPTAKARSEAEKQAKDILALVEGTAMEMVGAEGEIQPMERTLLESPLASVLARIEPTDMERATSLLGPLALLAGATLYGRRVLNEYQKQHPRPEKPRPAAAAASPASTARAPVDYAQPGTLTRSKETA